MTVLDEQEEEVRVWTHVRKLNKKKKRNKLQQAYIIIGIA